MLQQLSPSNPPSLIPSPDLTIAKGIPGIPSSENLPANFKYVYPLIPAEYSAEKGEGGMEKSLLEFLEKHEKVILVSFGLFYKPDDSVLEAIDEFLDKHGDQYAMIFPYANENLPEHLQKLQQKP